MKQKVDLPGKFMAVEDALREEHVDLDTLIHLFSVALVAGQHLFIRGGPGVAKTQLFKRYSLRVSGARTFSTPVYRRTPDEDLFGPYDLPGLEVGHWRRIVEGYLPWADWALIDEIFSASPTLLRGLVWALNERWHRNDGRVDEIPLSTVIAPSNVYPEDDELAAVYDRFLLRFDIPDRMPVASLMRMLSLPPLDKTPPALLAWDEVLEAKTQAAAIPVPDSVVTALGAVYSSLLESDITLSPRRINKCLDLLRAEAWLDGAHQVATRHIMILTHSLWDDPSQRDDVTEALLDHAAPLERRLSTLTSDLTQIRDLVDRGLRIDVKGPADEDRRHHIGIEVYDKVQQADADLIEIEKLSAEDSGMQVAALLASCSRTLSELSTIAQDLFEPEGAP